MHSSATCIALPILLYINHMLIKALLADKVCWRYCCEHTVAAFYAFFHISKIVLSLGLSHPAP